MSYNNYDNQYSTTSYGAQGGAGGGGFMGGSQTSPSGEKNYTKDSLRPVTIKQLMEAEQISDQDFKSDGAEITQVTIVGQIRNVAQQTTNVTYKLDDGTGSIEVKQWTDSEAVNNEDSNESSKLAENMYVRVWGKLKSFNTKRHLGATCIRPITDYNEVSYHLLEAAVVHLYFTRGPPGGAKGAQNGGYGAQQTEGHGNEGMTNGGNPEVGRASPAAKQVYQAILTSPQTNEGLHFSDIATRLGWQTADVLQAGNELLDMGVIYTTTDDHTWAILNM
ncbi:replication protein A, subunit RPA32 [Rhizodiscina lignyota]|uniref:Replication protein A, subunit RPA32 n=1 Tax=Rhizodiscina lignyota TaxID=1504668 RepID=A0A9P4I8Z2_9PEZI|nr:replication protein A, subunit RPA32 [Rhizodiscina lignyota]